MRSSDARVIIGSARLGIPRGLMVNTPDLTHWPITLNIKLNFDSHGIP